MGDFTRVNTRVGERGPPMLVDVSISERPAAPDPGVEALRRQVATLGSIAELIESIRDIARLQLENGGADQAPARRARRVADTGIALAGQISAIADQTNLLALHAAIEAEQGRAFAGVVEEARKLAAVSNATTRETEAALQQLVSAFQG
jgi:hypothetical protein